MIQKERLLTLDARRIVLFLIFVGMSFVTEFDRRVYRPYIYSLGIFDFWTADTIGNFTGTITIVCFDLAGTNPVYRKGRILVLIVTGGVIVYELLQNFSARSRCDWREIVATVIAGIISLGIHELVSKRFAIDTAPRRSA